MQLLVYIQIKPAQEIRFGNPFTKLTSDSEVQFYDADNHSDEWLINHQSEAINKAERITLILDVSPDTSLGKISKLMEKLFRQKIASLRVFLYGTHPLIDSMLKISKQDLFRCNDWSQLEKEVSTVLNKA